MSSLLKFGQIFYKAASETPPGSENREFTDAELNKVMQQLKIDNDIDAGIELAERRARERQNKRWAPTGSENREFTDEEFEAFLKAHR